MAPHRNPLPGRPEIGFGRHGILLIAQLIGGIGQGFNQGDPQIRRVPLLPLRHQQRQAIEHHAAKARKVLGQVVDVRRRRRLRRVQVARGAIERAGAFHFEGEVDGRKLRVDPFRRGILLRTGHQPQRIGREIARLIDLYTEDVGRFTAAGRDLHHLNVHDPLTAFDADVLRGEYGRAQRLDEMHVQNPLPLCFRRCRTIDDFQEINAVPILTIGYGQAADLVAARVPHAPTPCTKVSVARVPSRRMTN